MTGVESKQESEDGKGESESRRERGKEEVRHVRLLLHFLHPSPSTSTTLTPRTYLSTSSHNHYLSSESVANYRSATTLWICLLCTHAPSGSLPFAPMDALPSLWYSGSIYINTYIHPCTHQKCGGSTLTRSPYETCCNPGATCNKTGRCTAPLVPTDLGLGLGHNPRGSGWKGLKVETLRHLDTSLSSPAPRPGCTQGWISAAMQPRRPVSNQVVQPCTRLMRDS